MARKTRRRIKRLPFSRNALSAIIVSLIELMIFVAAIMVGGDLGDQVARIFSSLGIACVFISVVYFIISIRQIAEHEYDLLTRIVAILLSAISLLLWVAVYLVGLVVMFKK